ncbi:MAG: hypothetical protein OEU50_04555 [Gammaproteobacteria bacterium]|nr:hypothetical protein [Gammaproteobacteria bacterium]
MNKTFTVPVEPIHKRRPIAGWWLSFSGYLGIIATTAVWLVSGALAMEGLGELLGFIWYLVTMPVLFLAMPVVIRLISRGRSMRAMTAQDLLKQDSRSAVVFLRSFDDDDLIDPSFTATNQLVPGRYENKLTRVLASIGPVVALGRPGEPHPELGAARLYVKDEHWRQAISDLIDGAALVVAIVGDSPGLWWEIEFSIEKVPIERLLFFFPYPAPLKTRQSYWRTAFLQNPLWGRFLRRKLFPDMEAKRQARYDAFRARINADLPQPLPQTLGEARFIAFSNEGRPIPIKPAKPSLLTRAITLNFNPLLDIPFKKELQPVVSARKNHS